MDGLCTKNRALWSPLLLMTRKVNEGEVSGGEGEGTIGCPVHHHSTNIFQALERLNAAVTEVALLSAASWLLQRPFYL